VFPVRYELDSCILLRCNGIVFEWLNLGYICLCIPLKRPGLVPETIQGSYPAARKAAEGGVIWKGRSVLHSAARTLNSRFHSTSVPAG
jgi:hypothetical protein